MKVLFVGDKPSKLMKPEASPFEGARCEKRFKEWAREITGGDMYYVINQINYSRTQLYYMAMDLYLPIIALGNNASKALIGIPHFRMPHPSGLNRQNNNKEYIQFSLNAAKEYVKSRQPL